MGFDLTLAPACSRISHRLWPEPLAPGTDDDDMQSNVLMHIHKSLISLLPGNISSVKNHTDIHTNMHTPIRTHAYLHTYILFIHNNTPHTNAMFQHANTFYMLSNILGCCFQGFSSRESPVMSTNEMVISQCSFSSTGCEITSISTRLM